MKIHIIHIIKKLSVKTRSAATLRAVDASAGTQGRERQFQIARTVAAR
jgi:hypothetical protein